ncbi:MAG: hypothetical protein IPM39_06545 [Chloroflexi bacterium]|nr:hypothetical protein [Chloroflexota bacterium]
MPPEAGAWHLPDLLPGDFRLVEAVWVDVQARYAADGRFHHTLAHIDDVLHHIQPHLPQARQPLAVQLAAWFHDAIYDPRRHDNEAQSAAYAAAVLSQFSLPVGLIDEVSRLIALTERHETAVTDTDGHILLDADLAILAAKPLRYDAYAQAIRREYAHVPEVVYRQGRTAVLEQLLARPSLYQLLAGAVPAHAVWESPARLNLRREIMRLAGAI